MNIEERNGLIIHKLKYIQYVLNRSRPNNTEDDFNNAIAYICENIDGFDPDKGTIETWLWWAVRASLSATRKKRRIEEVYDESAVDRHSANDDTREHVRTHEYKQARQSALNRASSVLDDIDRLILAKHYFDQENMSQIGRAIGMSPQGVRYRVISALEKMRLNIGDTSELR